MLVWNVRCKYEYEKEYAERLPCDGYLVRFGARVRLGLVQDTGSNSEPARLLTSPLLHRWIGLEERIRNSQQPL